MLAVDRIGVGEDDSCFDLELAFESQVKVGDFVLENVGNRGWIRHNVLYYTIVACERNMTDHGSEGVVQKLYDLFSAILTILDKCAVAFALLRAALNQSSRGPVSNPYGMHPGVLYVLSNQINNFCGIVYFSVSQQK